MVRKPARPVPPRQLPILGRIADAVTTRLPSGLYVTGTPVPPTPDPTPPVSAPAPIDQAVKRQRYLVASRRSELAARGRLPEQQGRRRWPARGRSRARRLAQRHAAGHIRQEETHG